MHAPHTRTHLQKFPCHHSALLFTRSFVQVRLLLLVDCFSFSISFLPSFPALSSDSFSLFLALAIRRHRYAVARPILTRRGACTLTHGQAHMHARDLGHTHDSRARVQTSLPLSADRTEPAPMLRPRKFKAARSLTTRQAPANIANRARRLGARQAQRCASCTLVPSTRGVNSVVSAMRLEMRRAECNRGSKPRTGILLVPRSFLFRDFF